MIQQWIYTYSCWSRSKGEGGGGGRGFGTYSWTDGLSLADIEELERRCSGYELPEGASSRPDAAERAGFPTVAQSFRLSSGKRAIVRAVYVGEGFYDHRWGAIMVHGMVKESGDWEGYPAEWMDSGTFWNELPASIREEAVKYLDAMNPPEPPAMPALEDGAFERSGNYSVERVTEHFRDAAARASLVRLATLWARAEGRPANATFGDDGKEAPWLVAGFSMLFPAAMSQDLAWATRLFVPMPTEEDGARWYEVSGMDPRRTRVSLENVDADPEAEALVAVAMGERQAFFDFLRELRGAEARDWRTYLRLYHLVCAGTGAEHLSECLEYLGTHGTATAKRRLLTALEGHPEILPKPLTKEWMNRLLAACGDGEENDRLCARLLLGWRRRFEAGAAEACFLDWLRQGTGGIGEQWLATGVGGGGDTQGLKFTIAAVAQKAGEGKANESVAEVLGRMGPGAMPDWKALLAFAAREFPPALPAVLERCPDDGAVDAFVRENAVDAETAVMLTEAIRKAGGETAAQRALAAYWSGKSGKDAAVFRDFFRLLEERDAPLAKCVYAEAFRRAAPKVARREELAWLMGKSEWIPAGNRAEYWRGIDRGLAGGQAEAEAMAEQLEAFRKTRPTGAPVGRSGFLAWAQEVLRKPNGAALPEDADGLATAYAELEPSDREEWGRKLLAPLYAGLPAAEDGRAAGKRMAQRQRALIRFFAGAADREGKCRFAEDYGKHAAKQLARFARKSPATDLRFGGLLRYALVDASDPVLVPVLRKTLLALAYVKTKRKLKDERLVPAMQDLTPEEQLGWHRLETEMDSLRSQSGLTGLLKRLLGLQGT